MQVGEIYLGFADHVWNQGWRPEVEIISCKNNSVCYRYRDCGIFNEFHFLDLSNFDKSFEKESGRTEQ